MTRESADSLRSKQLLSGAPLQLFDPGITDGSVGPESRLVRGHRHSHKPYQEVHGCTM
jgi:hypothetical protein